MYRALSVLLPLGTQVNPSFWERNEAVIWQSEASLRRLQTQKTEPAAVVAEVRLSPTELEPKHLLINKRSLIVAACRGSGERDNGERRQ